MHSMMLMQAVFVSLLFNFSLFAIVIDEDKLVKNLLKSSPLILKSEIGVQASYLREKKLEDIFGWNIEIKTNTQRSNESGLHSFEPIMKSLQIFETQLHKKTMFGLNFNLGAFTSQHTNSFIRNSTRTGLKFGMAFDLYQDIFGKKTQRKMLDASFEKKISQIKNSISQRKFINETRKLYWSLVFNNESLKILQALIQQVEKQVHDAQKRFAANATDISEVSRYRSLISTIKVQRYQLENQREDIIKVLKEFIPVLQNQNIQLADYNIEKATTYFQQCVLTITSFSEAPLKHTKYDELVSLLQKKSQNNLKLHETYDDIDIKLRGQLEHFGKNFDYRETYNTYRKNPRTQYNIGLTLSIPLGGNKNKTVDILQETDRKRIQAETSEILSKIHSLHHQTLANIGLLNKIDLNQEKNSTYARNIIKESQKKYSQARIMARDLIEEQNFALQIQLDNIKTKLLSLNMMLDYLSVFPEIPCPLSNTYL